MRREIGIRVFAVRNADTDNVYLYGRGVYDGDTPYPGLLNDSYLVELCMLDAGARSWEPPHYWARNQLKRYYKFFLKMYGKGEFREGASLPPLIDQLDEYVQEQREFLILTPDERVYKLLMRASQNPHIALDNGNEVWGMECWWGPEDRYDEFVGGRTVHIVGVQDQR